MNKFRLFVAICALNLTACQTFLNSSVENKLPYIRSTAYIVSKTSLNNSKNSAKSIAAVKKIYTALDLLSLDATLTPDDFKIAISKDQAINNEANTIIMGIYLIYRDEFYKITDGNYKNIFLVVKSISEGLKLSVN